MWITRQGILDYWQKVDRGELIREPAAPGFVRIWDVPFPDLGQMSWREKRRFREILRRHPEWLSEIGRPRIIN